MLSNPRKEQIYKSLSLMGPEMPQEDFYIQNGEAIDDLRAVLQDVLDEKLGLIGINKTDPKLFGGIVGGAIAGAKILDADYTLDFAPGRAWDDETKLQLRQVTGLRLTLESTEAFEAIALFRDQQERRFGAIDRAIEDFASGRQVPSEAAEELSDLFADLGQAASDSASRNENPEVMGFSLLNDKYIPAMRKMLVTAAVEAKKPGLARCEFSTEWLPAAYETAADALQLVLREEMGLEGNLFTITPPRQTGTGDDASSKSPMVLSAIKDLFLHALSEISQGYLEKLAAMSPNAFSMEIIGTHAEALRMDGGKMRLAGEQMKNLVANAEGNSTGMDVSIATKINMKGLLKEAEKEGNFEFMILLSSVVTTLQAARDSDPRNRINDVGGDKQHGV